MANEKSLQLSAAFLCHMTAEEKKKYNAEYYQKHKDYWREYYGVKGSRPSGHTRYDDLVTIDTDKINVAQIMKEQGQSLGKNAGQFGTENTKRQIIGSMVNMYIDAIASNHRLRGGNAVASIADAQNSASMIADKIYDKAYKEYGGKVPYSKKEIASMCYQRLKSAASANGFTVKGVGRTREKNVSDQTATVKRRGEGINEALRKQQEQNRLRTSDLNSRLSARDSAISKQQTANRLVTPSLNTRLTAISNQPEKVEKGKSLFGKLASALKRGVKSIFGR